jgi:hypothetical protein
MNFMNNGYAMLCVRAGGTAQWRVCERAAVSPPVPVCGRYRRLLGEGAEQGSGPPARGHH